MATEDDEILREFLVESREHLAGIESDLLAMEAGGADIDEEVVNRVFRAAHSIKGGAGFFALRNIQDLAHRAETVLDMIRSREMAPNPEVVNVLLCAFDQLRVMVDDPEASRDADIAEHVVALTGLTSSYLPPAERPALTQETELVPAGGTGSVRLAEIDLVRARKAGRLVYQVAFDLIHDVERWGLTPLDVIRSLTAEGCILDAGIRFDAVGTLDDEPTNRLPFEVLLATPTAPDAIASVLGLPVEQVRVLADPAAAAPAGGVAPAAAKPEAQGAAKPDAPAARKAGAPAPVPAGKGRRRRAAGGRTRPDEPAPAACDAGDPAPADVAPPTVGPRIEKPAPRASGGTATREAAPAPPGHAPQATGDATLRVHVDLLESLMNLAGELVLSRNELREALAGGDARALAASSQRINLVTSELQAAIMQTRMQPVGNVFAKFPRMVRDLGRELGKDITLELEGKDVELDKTIVEGLSDPLTHMVRNAVDHGIEASAQRIAEGKRPTGTIALRAYHEAGQVVIEVADDGRGIDADKVAAKALAAGQITEEQLAAMSDRDRTALILLPGLSTAEKVSDLSGRGVGMDVVRANLDRLGGKVEIDTAVGRGSLFRIKLPLTLAIIPSLVVSVDGDRFAIPQIGVDELIRVPAGDVHRRIELVGDAQVLALRGSLIPVVHLAEVIGMDGAPTRVSGGRDLHIVIVSSGALRYGLVVDGLHKTEEIVVKPLGRHLKGLDEYAGATIMGDGRIALILDVSGLAVRAALTAAGRAQRGAETAGDEVHDASSASRGYLCFRCGAEEVCALPLPHVVRVERIAARQVQVLGGQRTMQYRGASLPLVSLADVAAVQPPDDDQLAVVVCTLQDREVGLLAAMPVEVIETAATLDRETLTQVGIVGSVIVRDRTVLVVDLPAVVRASHPEWVSDGIVEDAPPPTGVPVVLVAEDSDFFRAQVRRLLEEEGYAVLEAPDGQAAWDLLQERGAEVRLVVTDIEMPRLSGFGLAERIRSDSRLRHLPIMAVTSLAADDDMSRGQAVGIDDYQVKLDRDGVAASARTLLARAAGRDAGEDGVVPA